MVSFEHIPKKIRWLSHFVLFTASQVFRIRVLLASVDDFDILEFSDKQKQKLNNEKKEQLNREFGCVNIQFSWWRGVEGY